MFITESRTFVKRIYDLDIRHDWICLESSEALTPNGSYFKQQIDRLPAFLEKGGPSVYWPSGLPTPSGSMSSSDQTLHDKFTIIKGGGTS